jgi:hypothetical protein
VGAIQRERVDRSSTCLSPRRRFGGRSSFVRDLIRLIRLRRHSSEASVGTGARAGSDSVENVKSVSGTFLRRSTLPVAAQAEAIKARYANGVLEIEIPKQARVETRRIPVMVN